MAGRLIDIVSYLELEFQAGKEARVKKKKKKNNDFGRTN